MKDIKKSPDGGSKNSLSSIAPGNIITGPPTFRPSPLKTGRDATMNSSAATQYNNTSNNKNNNNNNNNNNGIYGNITDNANNNSYRNSNMKGNSNITHDKTINNSSPHSVKPDQPKGKKLTINTSLPTYSANPNLSSSNSNFGGPPFYNQWPTSNPYQGAYHYPLNSQSQNPDLLQDERNEKQQDSPSFHQDDQNTVTSVANSITNYTNDNGKASSNGDTSMAFSNPPITPNHYGNNSIKQNNNTPYRHNPQRPSHGPSQNASSFYPHPPPPSSSSYSQPNPQIHNQTPMTMYHNSNQSGSNSNINAIKSRPGPNHSMHSVASGPSNINMNVSNPGVYHTPNLYGPPQQNSLNPVQHLNNPFPPQQSLMYPPPPSNYPQPSAYSISPSNATIASPPPPHPYPMNPANPSSQRMTSATVLVRNNPTIKKKMDRLSKKLETVVSKALKEHFDGYEDKKELSRALHIYQNQINSTLNNTVQSKIKEIDQLTASTPIYQNGVYLGQQGDTFYMENGRGTLDLVNPQNVETNSNKRRLSEDPYNPNASNNVQSLEPPTKKQTKRKGQWTPAEVVYADKLIEYFQKGIVGLVLSGEVDETTNLRGFLSERLKCDPMRVSKRYQRSLQYDGWLEYRTCVHRREARDKIPNKEIRKIRMEMAELENNFLEKIGEAPVNYNLEKKLTDSAPLSLAIPKLKSNFIPTTKTNASALSALKSPTNDGIIGNNLNSGNSNNTSPSSSKIVNKDDPEEEIVSVTNTDHDGEQDEGTFPSPSNMHPIKTEGKSPIAEKQDLMTTETSKATSIKDMPLKTIPSETSYVERKEKSEIDMEIEVSSYTEMNDVPLTSPPTSVNLDSKDKETQNVNNTTLDDKKNENTKEKEWHTEEAKTPTPTYKSYQMKVTNPSNYPSKTFR